MDDLPNGTTGFPHLMSYTIKPIKRYNWKPCVDITAYELALCIPVLAFHDFDIETIINGLPEEARRHFEEIVA